MGKKLNQKEATPFWETGTDPLTPVGRPELVFGIVGPVGVNRERVSSFIEMALEKYNYKVITIKVSNLIRYVTGCENLDAKCKDEHDRISTFMTAGTKIRAETRLGDALAILGISELIQKRRGLNLEDESHDEDHPELYARPSTAYIFDSLKHPHEVSTLRATYGRGFYLISAYSDRECRVENISRRVADSVYEPHDSRSYRKDAEALIERDEREQGEGQFGQNVQATFPMADLFINIDEPKNSYKEDLARFMRVVFNNPFVTPLKDESGMFHAEAASWRSSDLSRQVGASICTDDGEVVALGCNEVPKAGGGLYWDGDEPDGRDFKIGKDEGALQKRFLVAEIIEKLRKSDLLNKRKRSDIDSLIMDTINGGENPILEGLGALNVIEYGRAVHAEMAAISEATKRGVSVKGCTMYVNTFPCHICARHIIASGIKRVVYIEPYPKSLSGTLYRDSISLGRKSIAGKVSFEPFCGVAPRAYQDSFKLVTKRKNKNGEAVKWTKSGATTKLKRFVASYILIEQQIVRSILPKIRDVKIRIK